MRNLRVVVAALMLAGCVGSNGNDGESNQFCHTVPVRSIVCNSCTQVSDTGQAFDGHLSTFAVMGTGGSGTFVAGTDTQPGGSIAGVFFVAPNLQDTTITITTFLHGTQQETDGPSTRSSGSDACGSQQTCSWHDGGPNFVGLETTKNYDQIQVAVSNAAASNLHVNEICVR